MTKVHTTKNDGKLQKTMEQYNLKYVHIPPGKYLDGATPMYWFIMAPY